MTQAKRGRPAPAVLRPADGRRSTAWAYAEQREDGRSQGQEAGTGGAAGSAIAYAAAAAMVLGALLWSYNSVAAELWSIWRHNDAYSSGMLVPALAAYAAYARRRRIAWGAMRAFYPGAALIVLGFAMRFAGSFLLYSSAERLSLVVTVAGVALTVLGPRVARGLTWIFAFLLLMLPWPNRVYQPVALALQDWATSSAVFLLEAAGLMVARDGNVLHVGTWSVAVAEACSGLRMLTAFLIIASLVALLSGRGRAQNGIIVASSIPIAIACNTFRLAATALAFSAGHGERVNTLFHDFGGLAMMPLALAMLGGELWLLKRLFVPTGPRGEGQAGARERRTQAVEA